MAVVTRIFGLSLLAAGLGAGLGYALFGLGRESRDWILASLLFACVGAIVGAVAGAAGEIVAAQRRKPDW